MPCYADYMDPTPLEKEASKVLCLLDEIRSGIPVNPESREWRGFHGGAYNRSLTAPHVHAMTSELCALCRSQGVEGRSLEMQIWWRDHQKMDAQREERERKDETLRLLKEQALYKLTPEEKVSLGLNTESTTPGELLPYRSR